MSDLLIEFIDGRWQLRDPEQPKIHPISVDFSDREFLKRLKEPKTRQLLFKAVNHANVKTVFDATAGLGSDSALIASWGFQVTACEQNEKVFKLLEDGLQRLKNSAIENPLFQTIAANLKLIHGNSIEQVQKQKPEVIYLDPMYPDLKSSALPKKEMQLLRKLFLDVDPKEETLKLLQTALDSATKRVVLKRPPAAEILLKPSHSLEGKAVRFDVYVKT